MADDATDQPISSRRPPDASSAELEIKRRGRRRLIGAVALGLLAMVLLPMVFDNEPRSNADRTGLKQPKQEIAVSIPPRDGLSPLPPPTVPPAAPAATSAGSVPAPAIVSASAASSSADKTRSSAPEVRSSATSTIDAPKATAAVAAPKPSAPKGDAKPEAPPATKSATPGPSAPVPVAAHKKAEPVTTSAAHYVQLGAFKASENAKAITAKVNELKLPVVTDVIAVSGGNVTRVRVGPFANKGAAESALAQLKLIGVDGKLVAPTK